MIKQSLVALLLLGSASSMAAMSLSDAISSQEENKVIIPTNSTQSKVWNTHNNAENIVGDADYCQGEGRTKWGRIRRDLLTPSSVVSLLVDLYTVHHDNGSSTDTYQSFPDKGVLAEFVGGSDLKGGCTLTIKNGNVVVDHDSSSTRTRCKVQAGIPNSSWISGSKPEKYYIEGGAGGYCK